MVASSSLQGLRKRNQSLVLRCRGVQLPHVTLSFVSEWSHAHLGACGRKRTCLGDHWFDFPLQDRFEADHKVDLATEAILQQLAVDYALVGFAKAICVGEVVHQLPVSLCALELHGGCRDARMPCDV